MPRWTGALKTCTGVGDQGPTQILDISPEAARTPIFSLFINLSLKLRGGGNRILGRMNSPPGLKTRGRTWVLANLLTSISLLVVEGVSLLVANCPWARQCVWKTARVVELVYLLHIFKPLENRNIRNISSLPSKHEKAVSVVELFLLWHARGYGVEVRPWPAHHVFLFWSNNVHNKTVTVGHYILLKICIFENIFQSI